MFLTICNVYSENLCCVRMFVHQYVLVTTCQWHTCNSLLIPWYSLQIAPFCLNKELTIQKRRLCLKMQFSFYSESFWQTRNYTLPQSVFVQCKWLDLHCYLIFSDTIKSSEFSEGPNTHLMLAPMVLNQNAYMYVSENWK